MMPSFYQKYLEKYLKPAQLITLKMLVWLLQSQKQVRIERLAATLPLPILENSRRRHIQRFLSLSKLSVLALWFPIGLRTSAKMHHDFPPKKTEVPTLKHYPDSTRYSFILRAY
ncbi:MAG: hypothetical protein U7127_30565 [Phormidium sp.]